MSVATRKLREVKKAEAVPSTDETSEKGFDYAPWQLVMGIELKTMLEMLAAFAPTLPSSMTYVDFMNLANRALVFELPGSCYLFVDQIKAGCSGVVHIARMPNGGPNLHREASRRLLDAICKANGLHALIALPPEHLPEPIALAKKFRFRDTGMLPAHDRWFDPVAKQHVVRNVRTLVYEPTVKKGA